MCVNAERIEALFESTLDMNYEQIDKMLSELDDATAEEVIGRIIGNSDSYNYGC